MAERYRKIQRTFKYALAGNIVSAFLKMFFGIFSNSIAMIADSFHSIFDSFSSVIGMYGTRISSKPPDPDHPYGHGKIEYAASLGITLMMFLAAINLGREAIDRLFANVSPTFSIMALAAVTISMLISSAVSTYENRIGKNLSSIILIADSRHSLTDVFASLVVIAGFLGSAYGFPLADSLAALVVCIILGYVGVSLFLRSTDVLVDRGISLQTVEQIRDVVNSLDLNVDSHDIRGRKVADKMYVDMHMTVRGDMPLEQAHRITEIIEHQLRRRIRGTEEVFIHIEPHKESPRRKNSST